MTFEFKHVLWLLLLFLLIKNIQGQNRTFANYFELCYFEQENIYFDNCIKNALNNLNPLFDKGVPELGIPPFDPHFCALLSHQILIPGLANFNLKLINITEIGWTKSEVTFFKYYRENNTIIYGQYFPHRKVVNGDFDIEGTFFRNNIYNAGQFELIMHNLYQITTISERNGQLQVKVALQDIATLKVNISGLIGEQFPLLDGFIHRIVNYFWPIGLNFFKPIVNNLVSAAFLQIFSNVYNNLDFTKLFSIKK